MTCSFSTGRVASSPWRIEFHEDDVLICDATLKGIGIEFQHVATFRRRNDSQQR